MQQRQKPGCLRKRGGLYEALKHLAYVLCSAPLRPALCLHPIEQAPLFIGKGNVLRSHNNIPYSRRGTLFVKSGALSKNRTGL